MMFITDDGGFRFETKGNDKTFFITGDVTLSSADDPIVFHYNPTFKGSTTGVTFVSADVCINDGSIANLTHNYSEAIKSGSGSVNGEEVLFSAVAIDTDTQADNIIGFKSNVSTTVASETYNFYSAGSAPNYFKGSLRISEQDDVATPGYNNTNTGFLVARQAVMYLSASTAQATPMFVNSNKTGQVNLMEIRQEGNFRGAITITDAGEIAFQQGTSDYRAKENVVELGSAVDTVKALRPVNFNFKTHPGKTTTGFIAHELQEQVPLAVFGEKDATEAIGTLVDYDGTVQNDVAEPEELSYTEDVTDEEGVVTQVVRTRSWTATGTRDVMQSVDQTKLIPLLTKALQEALERIEALEAQVNS